MSPLRNQFDLSDKKALVMGGRGFLGRRFCRDLAEFGAVVHAADLPEASPSVRAIGDEDRGVRVMHHNVDVTDRRSILAVIQSVQQTSGAIDILVYAATAKPNDFYAAYTDASLDGWHTILRAELDGLFMTSQEVGRLMEDRGGSMIFLSSIYGVVGNDQRIYEGTNLAQLYAGAEEAPRHIYSHAGYAAAKGAVVSMTRFLAAYWGGRGIRVNCVSPGGIGHPGEDGVFVANYSKRTPLGRKAEVGEVSGAVIYLASDASSYVTGHNLIVDGGWTAW